MLAVNLEGWRSRGVKSRGANQDIDLDILTILEHDGCRRDGRNSVGYKAHVWFDERLEVAWPGSEAPAAHAEGGGQDVGNFGFLGQPLAHHFAEGFDGTFLDGMAAEGDAMDCVDVAFDGFAEGVIAGGVVDEFFLLFLGDCATVLLVGEE